VNKNRYLVLAAVAVSLVFAFCCYVFWAVFGRSHGTAAMVVAIVAQGACFGVGPFFAIYIALAYTRKSLRPPNYPRINHLRISGKYESVGKFGEAGISPLRLT